LPERCQNIGTEDKF